MANDDAGRRARLRKIEEWVCTADGTSPDFPNTAVFFMGALFVEIVRLEEEVDRLSAIIDKCAKCGTEHPTGELTLCKECQGNLDLSGSSDAQ